MFSWSSCPEPNLANQNGLLVAAELCWGDALDGNVVRIPHLPENKHLNEPKKVCVVIVERWMISFSQAPSIFCRNLYPDFPGNIKEEIRIYFAANTWGFHNHKGKNRQGKKKKTVLTWIFLWLEGIILHSDKGIMPFAVVPETGCTGHFCILSLQHQSKTWLNPDRRSLVPPQFLQGSQMNFKTVSLFINNIYIRLSLWYI